MNSDDGFIEFANEIRKVHKERKNRVRGSYGSIDGFKWYREHRPKDSKYSIKDVQYLAITRRINQLLAEAISNGEDVTFPDNMGRLEIRKFKSRIKLHDGKIYTNLPIDWNKTVRLWYEDEEAHRNKTLVRIEEKEIYQVYYNRTKARFPNRYFYCFEANRKIKRTLKKNIKENKIEAFIIH